MTVEQQDAMKTMRDEVLKKADQQIEVNTRFRPREFLQSQYDDASCRATLAARRALGVHGTFDSSNNLTAQHAVV